MTVKTSAKIGVKQKISKLTTPMSFKNTVRRSHEKNQQKTIYKENNGYGSYGSCISDSHYKQKPSEEYYEVS